MNRGRPATRREVVASRCVAVAGAAAAVLHVPLAVAHAPASLPLSGALLVMSLVCLPCAGHLWRCPGPRTWSVVVVAGTAMLLAHAALLPAPGTGTTAVLTHAGHAGHAGHATTLEFPWHSPVLLAVVGSLTLAQVATCARLLLASTCVRLRGIMACDAAPARQPRLGVPGDDPRPPGRGDRPRATVPG